MTRSLTEYRRKRDFTRTPEPKGTPEPTGHDRFVVQKHWATRLHYDFRLEMEGVLVSWAIPKGPTLNPAERRLAAHVEDHPVDYFDFEGLIPKGEYGGGTVMVWDWGTYELEEGTPGQSLERGEVKFRLRGEKLRGRYALVRTRSEKDWLLIKKRDEAADPSFDIETLSYSVKSGRAREEIEAGKDAVWSSRRDPGAGGLIDLAQAEAAPMPQSIDPMRAQLVEQAFDDPRWLFEIKWDGIRLISFLDNGSVRLQTRRGRSVDHEYPQLRHLADLITLKQAVLDGEVVALDPAGRPSFQLLQNRGSQSVSIQYVVYDLLYADGRLLYRVPLEDRKRLLQNSLRPSPLLRFSDHVVGDGKAFFEAAKARHLEGIVGKLRDSPYLPGARSSTWLKIKTLLEQEVVIGGFTQPRGGRKYFGALIVGVYDDGELVYTGHTGGGFDERTLAAISKQLSPLVTRTSPFAGKPPKTNEPATWVRPELVCEVKFSEWTNDGRMRQPVFTGMRDDVDPRAVRRELPQATAPTRAAAERRPAPPDGAARPARRAPATASRQTAGTHPPASRGRRARTAERTAVLHPTARAELSPLSRAAQKIGRQSGIRPVNADDLAALDAMGTQGDWQVAGRTVHLTNLDKVLFPEDRYTKRDLIRYYTEVGPVLIPYFSRRPLSMNPHPDGIHGKSFWQKDKPAYAPEWIPAFRYRDQKNEKDWILVEEVATLAWLANHAVIDMHPWYSRVDKPEYPDWAVVDLDPAEGATFEQVVGLARVVKSALDHLKLKGVLKTTGQSGLHVYIPIERRYTHDESRGFVEQLAHTIAVLMPETVTEDWQVSRRTGKIRIDYTQNVINKTLAGPYSVRPAPGAPVSTPIRWSELDDPDLRPNRWTIATIGDRLLQVGDLFTEALTLHQRLPHL